MKASHLSRFSSARVPARAAWAGPFTGPEFTLALAMTLALGPMFLAACGGKDGDVTAPPVKVVQGLDTAGIVPLDPSRPADTLRVATLNMSIGFPVSQLFFYNMDDTAVAYGALVDMHDRYLRGFPGERIKAMAKAVVEESLDVVGLQEVMVLRRSDTLVNDFLGELTASIKAQGGPDYQVFHTVMNDTLMRGKKGDSAISLDFREGQAMLVRPGFTVLDSARYRFFSLLSIPVKGQPKTERGADYLRVKSPRGLEFQVFNTHLEVFNAYSNSQAAELGRMADSLQVRVPIPGQGGKERGRLQLILGDFNAAPQEDGHRIIGNRGFVDTFVGSVRDPAETGATCCVAGSALWRPDTAFSDRRIDFVMARGLVGTVFSRTNVKGAYTTADGIRFLASDHRMVVARLVAQ